MNSSHRVDCRFRFSLDLGLIFVSVYFCHFVPVLFAFVALVSVSSVLSQEMFLSNGT